ncbi:methylated-DNA--[protein]-cysteine S-methyltransferase [Paenibacillus jiagnxiensis]|uniref:methylated-DNA--[protein]-cysteine S-methyltransferase n=1 Tax=Paenibacillus jiagnxiensis TaxID=3228926 RepID=UPI0033BC18BD
MNIQSDAEIYWTLLTYENQSIHLAASDKGLAFVGSGNGPFHEMADWLKSHFPGSRLVRDDSKLQIYSDALIEYLEGKRSSFSLPLHLQGTLFQKAVWDALGHIPYGETRTYSEIATQLGKASAVRAVAAAIGANPALIFVPCHRVIGKNGTLTGYRGGLDMKKELLTLESAVPSVNHF